MIDKEIFSHRRLEFLNKMKKNSVAIIPANTLKTKNGDVHFHFRQSNNFYYLTCFSEPDSILILLKEGSSKDSSAILLCSPKNPALEQWTGYICGPDNAKKE